MNLRASMARKPADLAVAFQFLTRIPMPNVAYAPDSLARAAIFFPSVGATLGYGAALLHRLTVNHFSRSVSALIVLVFMVLVTGGLHEDGLADAADGFGGGRDRVQTLRILRDSRIGSYGALALVLAMLARVLLLSTIPIEYVTGYLVTAETLSRWTSLPLSLLPSARAAEGQGARLAQSSTRGTLIAGSVLAFGLSFAALRINVIAPVCFAIVLTALSARFFLRRIGGVTGDCFGATIQLTQVAVLCCGAWSR